MPIFFSFCQKTNLHLYKRSRLSSLLFTFYPTIKFIYTNKFNQYLQCYHCLFNKRGKSVGLIVRMWERERGGIYSSCVCVWCECKREEREGEIQIVNECVWEREREGVGGWPTLRVSSKIVLIFVIFEFDIEKKTGNKFATFFVDHKSNFALF